MKRTKNYDAVVKASKGGKSGSFEAVLSAPTLDRDGDTFATNEWKTPLPSHITIDIDHGMSAATTVGSAEPYFDTEGNLCVRGTFASTPLGQEIRTLVNEGHIRTMSVACLEDSAPTKDADGNSLTTRELLNGAFVAVPSNREAVLLSSKGFFGRRSAKAAQGSLNDLADNIHDAVAQLGGDQDDDGDDPWVQEIFLDELNAGRVVYEYLDQTMMVPFTVADDGAITLGESEPARLVTTVDSDSTPAAEPAADDSEDATPPAAEAEADPAPETAAAAKPGDPDDDDAAPPADPAKPGAKPGAKPAPAAGPPTGGKPGTPAADPQGAKPAADDPADDDDEKPKPKAAVDDDELKAQLLAEFESRIDQIFAARSGGDGDQSPDDDDKDPADPAHAAPAASKSQTSAERIAANKARALNMRLGLLS